MRYEQLITKDTKKKGAQAASDILEAAVALFLERGFCDVTVRDIATKAGVNPAMIPYYYTSKDKLGNAAFLRIADQMFHDNFESIVNDTSIGCAEKMYVCTILSAQQLAKQSAKFYYEFMEFCHENHTPSSFITQISQNVIREYHLNVSPAENEIYLTALIGSERFLITRRNHKLIDLTDETITNLILSNYFFNINLQDQTIADIITRSKEYLNQYDRSLMH